MEPRPIPDWQRLWADKNFRDFLKCQDFSGQKKIRTNSLRNLRGESPDYLNGFLDGLEWVEQIVPKQLAEAARKKEEAEREHEVAFADVARLRFGG